MKKYLFEIDIVKCDMPLSAAVLYLSGQKMENKFPEEKKISNNHLFNEKHYEIELTDSKLIFNANEYDFINNTLVAHHDGTVTVFPKVKGQTFIDVQYLDRNRVLAHIFYDRSSDELYVMAFTRQRMNDMFIPRVLGKFDHKINMVFNNFIQMLECVTFNLQKRWAIKPKFEDFNISIQTNQYLLNKEYLFLEDEIILVKKNQTINIELVSSRFQNDFDFTLDENSYVIKSDCANSKFDLNKLNLEIYGTGFIEILPKKFNRILFDGYSVPLEEEHILIKVIEG